ncbi:hypothetical protein SBV1_560011 [Verrucomicrobia bacterium]|nr:hypothetical protein SBV1_560011 [Verrucomicrobiota bacterium]
MAEQPHLQEGGVLAGPMNLGFFGVEGGVSEGTSASERTNCEVDLHAGYTNDWPCLLENDYQFRG